MQRLILATVLLLGSVANTSVADVVTPEEFWQSYTGNHSGKPLIIDVRTHEEFIDGHLPGAINIPYEQIESLTTFAPDKSQSLFIYCRSGRRSGIAEATLSKLGYSNIFNGENYQALAETMPDH
ncbi:rhodanese-like domain-containing protein [Photobacterium gaetbulicola]|uniref:Phage shock protein E n=2 Tax=Photobacterium gaetbulicola TaxID=1295392 RepID=A0A0C5WE44_9GAMM|nr:rhodanese-like domain-containing protein [Photobacterium gaetbulicola]AJR10026.1 phage shock protein E [Photobacterium gaetbulicola Gung47]KHT65558.1 phage-shock protein [Photobacterium gaetbulicola]PSU05807.1 rhodanese-like domain-containing protein [Photobacterium gaetbulicola]